MEVGNRSLDAGATPDPPPSARLLAWVDRRRWWVFAAVAVLYAVSFTGRWRVAPDSALAMSLGRSLAEGAGFFYHGEPHKWVEPGLPWLIAASFRLFGTDSYGALAVFILGCGAAALSLVYTLFKLHVGRPGAVLLTALLAVCETFYRYCYQIVTDMPFLVGMLAVLLAYERLTQPRLSRTGEESGAPGGKWWDWALLALGTLVMNAFRPTVITFVGALALATAWHLFRGPHRVRHALVFAVVALSLLAFRLSDPRRATVGESAHREATLKNLLTERRGFAVHRMFTRFLPEMLSEHTPEALVGIELGTGIDPVFSVVVIGLGVALVTRRVLWGAWVAATVAQMAFWLPRERYFLPILPLLLLALWYAALWLERRLRPPLGSIAFAGVLLLLFVPNLVQDGVFVSEQRWRGVTRSDLRDPTARPLVEMGRLIAEHVGERDIVLAEPARELTYFSRRKVLSPPRGLRQPPTELQEELFDGMLMAAPRLYAVTPEERNVHHVQALVERLDMKLGPAVATVEQPPVKKRPRPPMKLSLLVPRPAAAPAVSGTDELPPPATRPATAGG